MRKSRGYARLELRAVSLGALVGWDELRTRVRVLWAGEFEVS